MTYWHYMFSIQISNRVQCLLFEGKANKGTPSGHFLAIPHEEDLVNISETREDSLNILLYRRSRNRSDEQLCLVDLRLNTLYWDA